MPTLLISEKNQAAKAIAEALGKVKIIKKSKFFSIYYVPSKRIYILPLRGHLLSYRNTKAYKSWSNSNPRDIIIDSNSIEKVPLKYAPLYINSLKEYAKLCDMCIIGTDADIEGCNIGLFDALPFIKKENINIKVYQLWLSSLQKSEIIQKYNNLIPPKYSWGASGEARAIIDAIIGFSATREITNTLKPLINRFQKKFISIGRVQTSLLYLIYLRDKAIKNFVPEAFFTIDASLNYKKAHFKASHYLNPFKKIDEKKAKTIFNKIKDEKIAIIINNDKIKKYKTPPSPLNTSKALVLITKNLKISANLALNTMNQLYLNKIISYPRTDSDIYNENFNHIQFLKKFTVHSQYGSYASKLLSENRIKPTKGKKDAGDHPPITPLVSLELNSPRFNNNIQKKIYNLLARHYLALFGNNAIELNNKLKLSVKNEYFNSQFISLISEGFLEIAPFLKSNYSPILNIEGETIPIENISFNEKETQPPPHYSDTSLLKLMEKKGLGTKSTRPIIIELLLKRELIIKNKRNYKISELGRFLIKNLKDVWLPFLKPNFTKFIEDLLNDIKENQKKMEDVVNIVRNEFLKLFDKFRKKKELIISNIDKFEKKNIELFEKNNKVKSSITSSSMCPLCKSHPMKLIISKNKKRFLRCLNSKCKNVILLPQRGKISILTSECSICNFNIFKIRTKKYNKFFNYFICPQCWNDGLKKKITKGFCSNCKDFKIINDKCVKK